MKLSVVIPVLNEKEVLPETLRTLMELHDVHEIIIVDGGSSDGTREWTATHLPPNGCIVDGVRGRGSQLNAGARAATGDVVLFLHADTRLPASAVRKIKELLSNEQVVGGGFLVRFQEYKPWILRLVAGGINFRTRLSRTATGDQAIFTRMEAFVAAGGFAEWPVFEDVDFVQRLKRIGRFAIAPVYATTSARRYITWGVLRTVLLMYGLRIGFWVGISPFRLHRWFKDVRIHLLRDG